MYAKHENDTQKKIFSKATMLRPRVEVLRRDAFAKSLERRMLDAGHDYVIRAKGANKQTLEVKFVLMSRPLHINY